MLISGGGEEYSDLFVFLRFPFLWDEHHRKKPPFWGNSFVIFFHPHRRLANPRLDSDKLTWQWNNGLVVDVFLRCIWGKFHDHVSLLEAIFLESRLLKSRKKLSSLACRWHFRVLFPTGTVLNPCSSHLLGGWKDTKTRNWLWSKVYSMWPKGWKVTIQTEGKLLKGFLFKFHVFRQRSCNFHGNLGMCFSLFKLLHQTLRWRWVFFGDLCSLDQLAMEL